MVRYRSYIDAHRLQIRTVFPDVWSTGASKGCVFESQSHPLSLTDLIKANVLIDEAKHVRLADFALLTTISDTTNLISSSSFTPSGTYWWMGLEPFDLENFGLEDSRPMKRSDCYAAGMLIYAVPSGKVPFSRHHGYQQRIHPHGSSTPAPGKAQMSFKKFSPVHHWSTRKVI